MGIKHGDVGIYVDKVESQDFGIKLFSEVGRSFPLHCTALGKVLLAYCDEDETNRVLSLPLQAYTDRTEVDPVRLKARLRDIREQGYSLDVEEITRGIVCAAAPVFGGDGRIMCAVSTTFPSYVYKEKGGEAVVEAVVRHAAMISGVETYRKDMS